MNNADKTSHSQPLTPTKPKPKILVVDDSRLVRVTVKKLLSAEFDVLEAVDGEDGWDVILKNNDLKAILTDAGMPKLDGYELIARVRGFADSVISKLPMIMITGAEEGQTELRQKALDIGASDFIIKPFDKAQMIARMRSYVKQDELQRDLKTSEKSLATHATINSLTKLNNLRYFLKRSGQELALAYRHTSDLSLVGIRIDNIEQIRAKYDPSTVDKIILWTVKKLTPLMRKEDILTHTDQAEFIIIAPLTNRMSCAIFCDRVRREILKNTFSESVLSLPISVSMGLVNNVSDKLDSSENCLEIVRTRLTSAQSLGGNRIIASGAGIKTPLSKPNVKSSIEPSAKPSTKTVGKPKTEVIPFDAATSLQSLSTTVNLQGDIDLSKLANKLLPLLEHIDTELKLDISEQINDFRKKLLMHTKTGK